MVGAGVGGRRHIRDVGDVCAVHFDRDTCGAMRGALPGAAADHGGAIDQVKEHGDGIDGTTACVARVCPHGVYEDLPEDVEIAS
jgi:hypothetical protein